MVLSMERWGGKVAIVTGASSGIGAAVSKQLVQSGVVVVGVARRMERVEDMAKTLAGEKGKLIAYKADLCNREEIKPIFDWTTENVGPVAILVNNAGVHMKTSIIDGNVDAWQRTLDLNVMATTIAIKEAINIMRKNNIDGHIININSVLGHQVPSSLSMDIYPASKFAVTALTESLRFELTDLKSKIKVTSLSPGVVDTEVYGDLPPEVLEQLRKTALKAEDIADGVIYALSTPPHVQIKELTIKPVGEPF